MTSRRQLVSVIIPSYNHAAYIEQAILSVLTQNWRPLELIIVDDGSTDGSPELIESLVRKHRGKRASGVQLQFCAETNRGAPKTINFGLSLAKGEILTILNSDDYYLPGRISRLVRALKPGKSELAMSVVRHVDNDGNEFPYDHLIRRWYAEILMSRFPTMGFMLLHNNIAVTTGNLLFTRRHFERVGGFREFQLVHDYDFILRSLLKTEPALVSEALIAYRVHGGNAIHRLRERSEFEGPQIALSFAAALVLNPEPENPQAPCSAYWKNEFENQLRRPKNLLLTWLGGQLPNELKGPNSRDRASNTVDL